MPSPQTGNIRTHLHPLAALLAAALALAAASPQLSAQEPDVPHFKETDFPSPPQQGKPWTPPKTTIPATVVDAFVKLFQQGLADPRGCEYREASVFISRGSWQYMSDVTKIHGWVYAGKGDEKFVIDWDGVIHPAISVGAPADLRADVQAMIEGDDKVWKKAIAGFKQQPNGQEYKPVRYKVYGFWDPSGESEDPMSSANAALLLVLGQGDLASKIWSQWTTIPDGAHASLPWFTYASDWMHDMQEQMNGAFLDGDDNLALATGRGLAAMRKTFDTELQAHRGELTDEEVRALYHQDYFVPLLAELERRAAEPPYTPLYITPGTAKGPERIKLLIRDLEQVKVSGGMDGVGNITRDDPTVDALIKEGDPAVEPLLECYEKDTRMIRALDDVKMSIEMKMKGVHEAAYVALATILKTEFYNRWNERNISRDEVAKRIRDYLKQYGGLSQEERWFRILGDDNAETARWVEAMNNIVLPADLEQAYPVGGDISRERKPGENPPLMGESLRKKTSPSVTDLLLKRLQSVDKDSSIDVRSLEAAGRALATWDGRNNLEELRKVSEMSNQYSASLTFRAWLYDKRAELGDAHALDEYAAWLGDAGPSEFDFRQPHAHELGALFEPAWTHPDSPAIQKAIAAMFTTGSWSHLWTPDHTDVTDLIYSPLAGFAGFRQELIRGLGDKIPALSVTVKDGHIYLTIRHGGEQIDVDKTDPLLPPPGEPVAYRVCDVYAFYIADLPGAPECELYWPEAKRDEAVAASIKYLNDYGSHLGYSAGLFHVPPMEVPHAGISFQPLDHPATEDDVKQHRAIFALDGTRRLFKLPVFPVAAIRLTPGAPVKWRTNHGWPHSADNAGLGTVWQAEEKLVDGKWERYFGFAGGGGIARVPAAEIEFILPAAMKADDRSFGLAGHPFPFDRVNMPADWTCQPGGIDTQIADPDGTWKFPWDQLRSGHPIFHSIPMDKPLIAFSIRNRSGLDMILPAAFFQDEANRKLLPAGIKLSLQCVEFTPANTDVFKQPDMQKWPWKEIPIRDGSSANAEIAGKTTGLGTAEQKTVFNIDLRDFFDVSRRGFYQLAVTYEIPGTELKGVVNAEFLIGGPPWDAKPNAPADAPIVREVQ